MAENILANDPVFQKLKQQFNNLPRSAAGILPEPLNPSQTEVVLMGAASDAAQFLLGNIPVVGDVLADIVTDNIEANMLRKLTDPEQRSFREETRFLPNSVAIYRTISKSRAGKL